jgi:vancomycin permeability regulator SanA
VTGQWKRIVIAVVLIAAAVPIAIALVGLTAKPAPADVAIVFGNEVSARGEATPRLAARLQAARSLYERRMVRYLIVSGGVGHAGFDEASVMRSNLVTAGIPESAIVTDSQGTSTRRTGENAAAVMRRRAWRTADVVTQYYHVARARWACRRMGIRVVGAAVPRYFEWRDLYSTLREAVALPVYAWRG